MVHFNKRKILDSQTKGLANVIRALSIAIAGKHNFVWISQDLITPLELLLEELLPYLTEEEVKERNKNLQDAEMEIPFSHKQIISKVDCSSVISDVCGGGKKLKGGLFTASNVILLDSIYQVRSSVLQCFRVANSAKKITIARAGEKKVFNANFQTFGTTPSCPCGNYREKDKICLCSAKRVEQYWQKLDPIIRDTAIFVTTEPSEEPVSLANVRRDISLAYETQRGKGVFNNNLSITEVERLSLADEAKQYLEHKRKVDYLKKASEFTIKRVARTIADMDYREVITLDDIKEAEQYVLQAEKYYL